MGAATPHPSDMMFQLAAGDKRMRAVAGHKEQVGHRDTAAAARRTVEGSTFAAAAD